MYRVWLWKRKGSHFADMTICVESKAHSSDLGILEIRTDRVSQCLTVSVAFIKMQSVSGLEFDSGP